MSQPSERFKKRESSKNILHDIAENSSDYLIIHYSCESFYDLPEGNTPRITSLAVRSTRNAQTHSFSIHKIAELKGITPSNINQNYTILEREMLDEYFAFVSLNVDKKWIHINMRNINYGFEAINHRYKVLGGNPAIISDNLKIDLARLLIDKYGKQYVPHPRFESLYRLNNITMTDFLTGDEEAHAFVNGQYVKLHQSTLRKVDNMHNVITLSNEDDLKTKSNLFQIYGITPSGIFYIARDNWIVGLTIFMIGAIIAGLISLGITKIFS